MSKPRVIFIAMLGEPGRFDPDLFSHMNGGDDETVWFGDMLEEHGMMSGIDYRSTTITHDGALPAPTDGEAIILGGSFHSVHDGRPWQADLQTWLGEMRQDGPPLFGICGGHQAMALYQGVPVGPRSGGARGGTFPVDLTEAGRNHYLFKGLGDQPMFHFGNEEMVAEAPAGSTVLAHHETMPAMALDHGGDWLSVQFHPEATAACIGGSWRDSQTGTDEKLYGNAGRTPRLQKLP